MIFAGVFIVVAGLIYLSVIGYLYRNQEKLLFHPKHFPKDFIFQYDRPFEEFFVSPEPGIELNILKFTVSNPKGAIIYFHGNRGHLGKSGSYFDRVSKFGYDVIMYDYRSYGKSNGKLSYKSLLSDGRFVYNWVAEQYGEENVVLHGCSLGSGIASFVATQGNPKQLVLETPYYSIARTARHRYPLMPVQVLNNFPLSNARFLHKTNCPSHIIHGTLDKTVPYKDAVRLHYTHPNSNLHTIEGGGHSNLKEFDTYHSALASIYR